MKLIEKDKIAAEIERLRSLTKEQVCGCLTSDYKGGLNKMAELILSFIDTLEVDIEDAVHGTVDYPLIGCDFPNIYPNYKELKEYCDRKGIKDNDNVKLIIIKDI